MSEMTTVLLRNKDCPVREVEGGVVILGPTGDTTHSLENLGLFIWQQIDGQKDLDAILALILEEYEVDEATARKDLLTFAQQLSEAGLAIENES